ncbi:Two component transcriptional regulator, winged helix family protein [Burkholderia sp. 8Y]|uniref:winged helix-turn-helix domain-containing protein n=1 Tax=Burkholderia sp. 8Y TaxID=2653133 RepID=UPI0012F12068|nr:response regulator transcription factor [Burkholderia sp. 8Y]VXC91293.1 Two component transcriptional regulator, winged helix family protein [Burkholderia sp. 8Y]
MMSQSHDSHRIVIVEPDEGVRQKLAAFLSRYYPATRSIANARTLAEEIDHTKPSLILLSNELTNTPLAAVLCDLRTLHSDIAVLVIGAPHGWMDAITCLDLGADDFVQSPCNEREILSRMRNLLRHRAGRALPVTPGDGKLCLGDFVLDPVKRTVKRKRVSIDVHDKLFELLALFARNPMTVMSRLRLTRQLSEQGCLLSERSVDALVCRLRRIVEDDPAQPRLIQTIRGRGYAFSPNGATMPAHS